MLSTVFQISKLPNIEGAQINILLNSFVKLFFNTFFHYDVVSIIEFFHIYKLAEKKQKTKKTNLLINLKFAHHKKQRTTN